MNKREKACLVSKEWRRKNPERAAAAAKKWRKANPEKMRLYGLRDRTKYATARRKSKRDYARLKYATDPVFRICRIVRARHNEVLKTKRDLNFNLLGCSREELKIFVESKFKPGMTWENHGEWEVDHSTPLSSGKTIDAVEKLCHYTNLQPLWRLENRSKGNRLVP